MPQRTWFVTREYNYFFIWDSDYKHAKQRADTAYGWIACFSDSLFDPSIFNLCLGEVK